MNHIVRKREVNAYLPRLALSFARGEISTQDLSVFFSHYRNLYSLGIDTNAICNLQCSYCYLDKYVRDNKREYVQVNRITEILSQAIGMGVDLIALVGKEPFADDRALRIMQFLDKMQVYGKNFRYGVVTNGTLVNRYINDIPKSIAYIDISLDGFGSLNDQFRGNRVYEEAIKSCSKLVESGFEVWISSVLHKETSNKEELRKFISDVIDRTGVNKFYFSPVRNFTGELTPYLLTYKQISDTENDLICIADELGSKIERIVLDHPYESVWRDYIWSQIDNAEAVLDELYVDGFGVIFQRLSSIVLRKLDIFPHGPWGTARIDAYGNYLPDVESRTYELPPSVGNISTIDLKNLFELANDQCLDNMLVSFLLNMKNAAHKLSSEKALTSVSIPILKDSSEGFYNKSL